MTNRLASLMLGAVLLGGATASAQTAAGPFGGSVVQGAVSADVLPLTLADAIERGLTHNLGGVPYLGIAGVSILGLHA